MSLIVFDAWDGKMRVIPTVHPRWLLAQLEQLVGGEVRLLMHKRGWLSPCMGYVRRDDKESILPPNDIAFSVMEILGFMILPGTRGIYEGDVILGGVNWEGLTQRQVDLVRIIYIKVLHAKGRTIAGMDSQQPSSPVAYPETLEYERFVRFLYT
jgi:hypothetical protein